MNVADLIAREFGVVTRVTRNPMVDEVMIAKTQILPNNPSRLGWTAVNLSANNIYIALDQDVASTHGILLTPSGGSVSVNYKEDFESVCWAAWAVAGADNSDIFIIEVLIDKDAPGGGVL